MHMFLLPPPPQDTQDKMGLIESKCVKLADAPNAAAYLDETYTVIRTGGTQDTNWIISKEPHRCEASADHYSWALSSHAVLKPEGWRVFLMNKSIREHSCGWRRLGTFWPTRLTGDQAAIDAWTAELKSTIEALARAADLPTEWHEHNCHKGVGGDCGGCMKATGDGDKTPIYPRDIQ